MVEGVFPLFGTFWWFDVFIFPHCLALSHKPLQRYDNFQERQRYTSINLLFWREWNLPLAKFLSVENNKLLKDLRTVWMIGFQVKTYYLCCSLFLLFRQSFISVAGCRFKPSRWIGKGFGAVYSPTEEESSCKWEQSQVYLSYAECSRVSVNCSKRFTARPFLILKEVWLPLHPTKGVNGWCFIIQWSIYSCEKRGFNVFKAHFREKTSTFAENLGKLIWSNI